MRARGDALAEPGPAALSQRLDEAHAWLEEHLPFEPPGRRLRVFAGKRWDAASVIWARCCVI